MKALLAGLALAGVIAIKRHKPREEKEAATREQIDTIFSQWENEEEPLNGQRAKCIAILQERGLKFEEELALGRHAIVVGEDLKLEFD